MSRRMRDLMTAEYVETLKDVDSAVLVNCQGLSAEEVGEFRDELRQGNLRLLLVKNSLIKRAFEEKGLPDIQEFLNGQTSLVWGGEDPTEAAKKLKDWNKDKTEVTIKGGFLEGNLLDLDEIDRLSKLPDKDGLRSMIAGLVVRPVQDIATLVNNCVAQVVWAVDALREKKEKEE